MKVLSRARSQHVTHHLTGYFTTVADVADDILAEVQGGRSARRQSATGFHAIFDDAIRDGFDRWQSDHGLVYGWETTINTMLTDMMRPPFEYIPGGSTAVSIGRDAMLTSLNTINTVDGYPFLPSRAHRRAFALTATCTDSLDRRLRTIGAKLLMVSFPQVFLALCDLLTEVVHSICTVVNSPGPIVVYDVMARHLMLYTMAVLHEEAQQAPLRTDIPSAWNIPLLEEPVVQRLGDMQDVRVVMYAAVASLDIAKNMLNIRKRELWEALQAVEGLPAYT